MSESEIKQWLKKQGYMVKKLGDRRFQVVRKYNKNKYGKNMSIASVFDGNTGKMESGYSVSKNNQVISTDMSKTDRDKNKRYGKSTIKRSKDEYLLFEITQNEKY